MILSSPKRDRIANDAVPFVIKRFYRQPRTQPESPVANAPA